MATVAPTFSWQAGERDGNCVSITWNLTTANADGAPIEMAQFRDLSFQSFATNQSTAVCTIQGSNDGTNYAALRDPGGTSLTFAADGLKQLLERPRFIRPNLTTGGTLAVIAITMFGIKNPVK